MKNYNGEKVLVFEEGLMSGLSNSFFEDRFTTDEDDVNLFIDNCLYGSMFIDREIAEVSPAYKQLIPYTLIKKGNKYLTYRRTSSGGEGRLHDKWSIGIGGHINPCDSKTQSPLNTLGAAITRELDEELLFDSSLTEEEIGLKIELIGLLYDYTNDVGKVHFGIVEVLELSPETPEPVLKETALSDIQWLEKEDIGNLLNLENWSQIVLNFI